MEFGMTERKSRTAAKPAAGERPRGGAARAVADMLPDVGRAAFRRFGFVQSSVVSRWPEIVGPRYAGVRTRIDPLPAWQACRRRADPDRGGCACRDDAACRAGHRRARQPLLRLSGGRSGRDPAGAGGTPPVARCTARGVAASIDSATACARSPTPELRACLAGLAGALAASSGPPMLDIPLMGKVKA
jgi:hypothetical protein